MFLFIYAEKIMNEPSSLMTPNIYKTNVTKSELKHSFDRGDRGLVILVLMNKSADVVKIPCSPALHKKCQAQLMKGQELISAYRLARYK